MYGLRQKKINMAGMHILFYLKKNENIWGERWKKGGKEEIFSVSFGIMSWLIPYVTCNKTQMQMEVYSDELSDKKRLTGQGKNYHQDPD